MRGWLFFEREYAPEQSMAPLHLGRRHRDAALVREECKRPSGQVERANEVADRNEREGGRSFFDARPQGQMHTSRVVKIAHAMLHRLAIGWEMLEHIH